MSSPENMTTLAGVRAEAARHLAERAADPATSLPELRDLHERLRLIEAGLAASQAPQPRRRWLLTLWPVLLVAALVSVGAAVPIRSVPFTLELQAREVALQLDAAGELASQAVDTELRVEGQLHIESPSAALMADADGSSADQLMLRSPHLTLRRVGYPARTRVVVRSGPQVQFTFDAPGLPLGAEVEFAGSTSWRVGDGMDSTPIDFKHAEWVRATTRDAARPGRRPPPLDVWLGRAGGKTYAWRNLRPVALEFVERAPGESVSGAAVVASSLEQGHLTLPATGGDVQVGAGDRLEIAGLVLERFELVAGDTVGIKLSGTARVLRTRTGDFERSLKPSLLEFASRHHTVSLLWSAALVLWGVIGWMRKQFDGGAV